MNKNVLQWVKIQELLLTVRTTNEEHQSHFPSLIVVNSERPSCVWWVRPDLSDWKCSIRFKIEHFMPSSICQCVLGSCPSFSLIVLCPAIVDLRERSHRPAVLWTTDLRPVEEHMCFLTGLSNSVLQVQSEQSSEE